MAPKVSPLAPGAFPKLPALDGVRLATRACGIKYKKRTDVCLFAFDPGTTVAGVLTQSKTAAAPVEWCRTALKGGKVRAIIINSGNANAFTGGAGRQSVKRVVEATAKVLGCPKGQVFTASTGVIGEVLPDQRMTKALAAVTKSLSERKWKAAAQAIMTTDTFPKGASRTAEIDGHRVTINGIAKGSGMIAPDMATMLSFITTDAKLPAPLLQRLLSDGIDRSFNCITVDGDTSTSDTVLLAATGRAGHKRLAASTRLNDPRIKGFRQALNDLLQDLAHQVVRDGEGAGKFVAIEVSGAASKQAARKIGLSVANSPLVKTAIAGEDANWGRVVMAVGKSGEKADRDKLSIWIGGIEVARHGAVAPGYDEAPVAQHMKGDEIVMAIDVGVGSGKARVWTCDLTHGYIEINADYRS
ncbi:MAG: bifunctional glutamate N-acetyltransferase/amino-acid acetyltransferase ArgJ [Pseudomonadota bacterium]